MASDDRAPEAFVCNRCHEKHQTNHHLGRCRSCGCPEFTMLFARPQPDTKESWAMKKSKPKKTAKKATKGESLAEISDLLAKIEKAEEAVEDAEHELNEAKEEAKTAKGVWLTKVSELRQLVRTRKRWAEEAKRQPLFNQKPDKAKTKLPAGASETFQAGALEEITTGSGKVLATKGAVLVAYKDAEGVAFVRDGNSRYNLVDGTYAVIVGTQPSTNGAWRQWEVELLGEHGLAKGRVAKLQAAGLTTMGKLVDQMNRAGAEDHWWKDIKGFGESGYDQLTEAIMQLRKAKPEFQAEAA